MNPAQPGPRVNICPRDMDNGKAITATPGRDLSVRFEIPVHAGKELPGVFAFLGQMLFNELLRILAERLCSLPQMRRERLTSSAW